MAYHVTTIERPVPASKAPAAGLGFAYIMPSQRADLSRLDPAMISKVRPLVEKDRAEKANEWIWVGAVSLGLVTAGLLVAWVLSGEATGKQHLNIVTQEHE